MIPFTRSGVQLKVPAEPKPEPEKAKRWLHSPPAARGEGVRESKKLDQGGERGFEAKPKKGSHHSGQCSIVHCTPLFAFASTSAFSLQSNVQQGNVLSTLNLGWFVHSLSLHSVRTNIPNIQAGEVRPA